MNTDRISKRARLLSALATALLLVIPAGAALIMATGGFDVESLRAAYGVQVTPDVLATGPTLIWFAVEVVKLAVLLWVIWCARAWLLACAGGRVFSGQTARRIQQIGIGLIGLAVAHVVGHTIAVLALTWGNPAGERALTISFGSTELFLLLAAGLVTLFGWIQAEAAQLDAENKGFV